VFQRPAASTIHSSSLAGIDSRLEIKVLITSDLFICCSLVRRWKSEDILKGASGMQLCLDKSVLGVFCGTCRSVAVENVSIAFLACISLLFALYGCINRMKYVSDCPVQKLIGCISNVWGAFLISMAVFKFQTNCYWEMPEFLQGYRLEYKSVV